MSNTLNSLRCLVVDDYESMRLILSSDLKSFGIQSIDFAKSGQEALLKIKEKQNTENSYQFIFTDMNMPNGSGIDLTTGIRKDLKDNKIPILMISSVDEVSQMITAVKAGISDYITKPWSKEILKSKIELCLQKMIKK